MYIILILPLGLRDFQLPDRPDHFVLQLNYGWIARGNAAGLLYLPYCDTDNFKKLGRREVSLHLNLGLFDAEHSGPVAER